MKRLPRPRPPFHPRVRSYTLFPSSARTPLMPPISFTVNGKRETVNVTPDTPLLWVLRDTLGLTGTKFGCGMSGVTLTVSRLPLTVKLIGGMRGVLAEDGNNVYERTRGWKGGRGRGSLFIYT